MAGNGEGRLPKWLDYVGKDTSGEGLVGLWTGEVQDRGRGMQFLSGNRLG